jgi:hypothetical protein
VEPIVSRIEMPVSAGVRGTNRGLTQARHRSAIVDQHREQTNRPQPGQKVNRSSTPGAAGSAQRSQVRESTR